MSPPSHRFGFVCNRAKKQLSCTVGVLYAGALAVAIVLTLEASIANCEAKEFDWSDLGVSLANTKPSLSGHSAANNLRILVSPQRRMTKNYEFEYTSANQTSPSQSDASYVVSSSNGSPYLTQSVYQLAPNHTSAYSALSASLASLKSRLNARGVTLTSTLGENVSQPTTGHLYSTQNAYGSSMLIDPSQQQAQQQQQSQQQVVQSQAPSQPTYLSVSSQQDQQSGAYTVPPSQGNDNKTIVLAIPAKINFLTGSKPQSQQHQQAHPQQTQLHQSQQVQQLSVLQTASEQQGRPEYATKQQLGVLGGSEPGLEAASPAGEPQEHHQYVIVNQPQMTSGDHHSHSVAANLSPAAVSPTGQVYSTIYQAPVQASGYAMKYIPTYASPLQQQPQQSQPQIQKVYSVIDSQPLATSNQQIQSPLPQVQSAYETQIIEQPSQVTRYTSCLDTCNSADPRWRKYTVSKYKACCSRSSQFDAAFEQPSADKVGESSSRYADDAYYSYLYRRSRARRSRRQRQGRYYGTPSRYHGSISSATGAQSGPAQATDEEPQVNDPAVTEGGRQSPTTGRSAYYNQEYPYMKQYRASRGYGGAVAAVPQAGGPDSAIDSTGRDEPIGAKYPITKERSYRRGRSRELEPLAEPQPAGDNVEDDAVYPPPRGGSLSSQGAASGYGNGEYSVDTQGRGYPSPDSGRGVAPSDEDEQTRFDEPSDLEPVGGKPDEYPNESLSEQGSAHEEGELDGLSSGAGYKYPTSSSSIRRKKSQLKSPRQQRKSTGSPQAKTEFSKYYKKARKNKYGKSNGEHSSSGNGTDYESAQPGDHHQDQSSGEHDDQSNSYSSKDSLSGSSPYDQSDSDKEAVLAKYRASLNETTVANLSKTTMHLKEILSILEKKAHLRLNETSAASQQGPQPQSLPVTSTPPPITTTTLYPPFSSLLSGSPYSSSLSSDFLSTDFGLKSPYRFDTSSLSGSLSPSALTLPSSFGSFGASEPFSPLTPPYPNQFSMHSTKPLSGPNGSQRKRRPSKSGRYNDLMFQKAAHSLMQQPSLLHAAAKNRLLNPAFQYSALQYPYLYRGSSPTITNPYPYKNLGKNPYSSLLNGPVSSKLASATSGQLYSDESRMHGIHNLDPLANMGSSLRPPTTMRLRHKPFVFQPQVLPIYTRHTILTQPMDVKA